MTYKPSRKMARCPNHPLVVSNKTGFCPNCCRQAALPPDIAEIRRAKRAAAWKVYLSLHPEERRAYHRRRYYRRKMRAVAS
jgi:hypothetical protein